MWIEHFCFIQIQKNRHWNVVFLIICFFNYELVSTESLLYFHWHMSFLLLKIMSKFCVLKNYVKYIDSQFLVDTNQIKNWTKFSLNLAVTNSKMSVLIIYTRSFFQEFHYQNLGLHIIIFTNPSARAGYDTRSIFKRSLTDLNSEFSFS